MNLLEKLLKPQTNQIADYTVTPCIDLPDSLTDFLYFSKTLNWFQTRVYEWDPYFKFPNRMIGTSIISLIGLYTVQKN